MAVTLVTTTMAGAINYTHVTDSSADWSSVPVNTYFYDKLDKLVHYKNPAGTILEIFTDEDAFVASTLQHNVKYGEAINKGQAVYVSSADGTNMIVSKASNAAESTSSKTMGLVTTSGPLNHQGIVVTEGLLAGTGAEPLDTSAATIGDPVWLGTGGNLLYGVANKPYAPAHMVFIGIVTRVSATVGEIFVKVQNGFEIDELHDVDAISTPPQNGDVLTYNAVTDLWEPKPIPGITSSGTQLLTGGASWSGTGMVFDVSVLTYTIDGVNYTSAAQNVTLAAGDSTNPRFDAIVVDVSGVVSVITGTPSANPIVPSIPGTQVLVQYVLVAAGATTPTITNEYVYREGSVPDWTQVVVAGSAPTMTANFSSTTPTPFQGAQCLLVNAPSYTTSKLIRLTKPSGSISRSGFPFLSFRVYLPVALPSRNILVRAYNNTTYIGAVYATTWGFSNTTTGSWQLVTIPVSQFGNPTQLNITRIEFLFSGTATTTNQFAFDDIKFQSGYGPQSATSTVDILENGTVVGDTAKVNFIDGSNTVVNVVEDIPNNKIDISFEADTLYTQDGTLTGDRTVNGNNFELLLDALKLFGINIAPGTGLNGFTFNVDTTGMSGSTGTRIFKVVDTNAGIERLGIDRNGNTRINNAYILPGSDGGAFQTLATNGSGVLYWTDAVTPSSTFIPPIEQSEIRRGTIPVSGVTTRSVYGGITDTITGSAVSVTFGSTVPLPKLRLLTTAGSTNSTVGIHTGSANVIYRVGKGFRFIGSYIYSDQSSGGTNWYVPGALQFCGLATGLSILNISSTVTVESKTNIIGIGSDATDTNLQLFHNDASGTCTKIDLGFEFAANKLSAVANTEAYQLELYNAFGSSSVKYRVRRLSDGLEATGVISTNLPAGSIDLGPQIVRSSGSTSQNVSIDLIQLTTYTRE